MPFTRPTLAEIVSRIISDFRTNITGATTFLRRSVINIMGKVFGGAVHGLYGHLEYQKNQLFVSEADTEYLDTHGGEYGVARTAATYAVGSGGATGTDGTTILAGTQLVSGSGIVYEVDSNVTIAAGIAVVDFTANIEYPGAQGNDDPGIVLAFVSPIVGVDSTITVDANGITGGTDEESDDNYRDRILERKRQAPHGGASFDYVAWAKEVAGTTRAWSIPLYMGIGTIGLAFVRDNDDDIFPSELLRDTMKTYIISHTDPITGVAVGIPVTAEPGLFIIELEPLTINFTIAIYPNTVQVQAQVLEKLEALFLESAAVGSVLALSQCSAAISSAVNEVRHRILYPTEDISPSTSQLPVVGTLTFQDY